MLLVHDNLDFNFELVIHRKTSSENLYCPDGFLGGDQNVPSILLIFKYISKRQLLILKIVSKIVYGFSVKSYEYFKIQNSEI